MRREITRGAKFGGLCAAAGLLVIATISHAQSRPDEIARGREIVTRDCSRCHAVEPSGPSPLPQAPPFRRLHQRYDVEALAEGLAEGLMVGHGPMPEWVFPPDDVTAIVAYLKSLREEPEPERRR